MKFGPMWAAAAWLCLAAPGVSSAKTARAENTLNISIGDFFFNPVNDTVIVHSTVQWTNNGSFNHGSTNQAGSGEVWSTGVIGHGASKAHTFDKLGIFPYECVVHGLSMPGTIVVISSSPVGSTSWSKLKHSYRAPAGKAVPQKSTRP